MAEKFLVTGALSCIGAWAVKRLLAEGVAVSTYDLPGSRHRLELILDEAQLAKIDFVEGDITDFERFSKTATDKGITHILHLAAFQVPFVRADPVQGMRVNAVGTTIVFETARRLAGQVQGIAYASSAGVYAAPERYPAGPLANDAPQDPPHLYGVTKQANEGTARIYWLENKVRSVGIRPDVVYGPGRDQGMTSTPTKAMLAAAVGRAYRISFGGTIVYHHADDAAEVFIRAARSQRAGADVFNLGGSTASMEEIVAAIDAAAPEMAGKITFDPQEIPAPSGIDERELVKALGPTRWRPLKDGVRQTVEHFRRASKAGKVAVEKILA